MGSKEFLMDDRNSASLFELDRSPPRRRQRFESLRVAERSRCPGQNFGGSRFLKDCRGKPAGLLAVNNSGPI